MKTLLSIAYSGWWFLRTCWQVCFGILILLAALILGSCSAKWRKALSCGLLLVGLNASGQVQPASLGWMPPGTILLLDFNGNSGRDLSPSANHGTIQSGASVANGSCSFDGSTGYVSFGSNPVDWTKNFTIMVWFNMAAISANDNTFIGNSPDGGTFQRFSYNHQYYDTLFYGGSASINNAAGTTTPLAIDTWYHAVVVNNANTYTIFLDGRFESATVDVSAPVGGRLGSLGPTYEAGYYMNGLLDEVLIVNRAMSAVEVRDQFERKR